MTLKYLVIVAVAVGQSGSAFAETWSAKPVLLPERSKPSCQTSSLEAGTYSLKYEGAVLSGVSSGGQKFATSAAADGSVRVSVGGAPDRSLELNGNAKTRDLIVYNPKTGCRWRLTSIQ
jgi:hypothetical protein